MTSSGKFETKAPYSTRRMTRQGQRVKIDLDLGKTHELSQGKINALNFTNYIEFY
jgi:hypothetical protein